MRALLLLASLPSCLTAAGEAYATSGLDALRANLSNSLALLQGNLGAFADQPCLRPASAEHIQGFQAVSTRVSGSFGGLHKNFMQEIRKPIEGNGKCEGGFNAVTRGAAERAWTSYAYGTALHNMQTQFAQSFDDHINTVPLHVKDATDAGKCETESIEMYKSIQQNGDLVNASFNAYRGGVTAVQKGFDDYYTTNAKLDASCDSLGTEKLSFEQIEKGVVVPVPSGKSVNPESTITGKIRNDALDSGTAPAQLARPTGLAVGEWDPSKQKASDKASILAASGAGGTIATGSKSEEMQVKALLKKDGGEASALALMMGELESSKPKEEGRGPASVAAPEAGMKLDGARLAGSDCSGLPVKFRVYAGGKIDEPGAVLLVETDGDPAGAGCAGLSFTFSSEQRAKHGGKRVFVYAIPSGAAPSLLAGSGSTVVPPLGR